MDKVKMGKLLAQLRTERDLRQQDEAEIFLVTPQAISKWEAGESIPDIAILEKLSSFYSISIEEIIKGERNPKPVAAAASEVCKPTDVYSYPTLEERGIGKPYYYSFIFCMAFLLGGILLSLLTYTSVGSINSSIIVVANIYGLLFNVNNVSALVAWIMVLFFIASTCMSIGLWLSPKHRRAYWFLGFYFGLASMITELILALLTIANFSPYAGCYVLSLFHTAYFVLYCSLPITRLRTFCPRKIKA